MNVPKFYSVPEHICRFYIKSRSIRLLVIWRILFLHFGVAAWWRLLELDMGHWALNLNSCSTLLGLLFLSLKNSPLFLLPPPNAKASGTSSRPFFSRPSPITMLLLLRHCRSLEKKWEKLTRIQQNYTSISHLIMQSLRKGRDIPRGRYQLLQPVYLYVDFFQTISQSIKAAFFWPFSAIFFLLFFLFSRNFSYHAVRTLED